MLTVFLAPKATTAAISNHKLIKEEAKWGVQEAKVYEKQLYADLSSLVDRVGQELSKKKLINKKSYSKNDAKHILASIALVLAEANYQNSPRDISLLSIALKNKTIDCDTGTHVYLSILQALKINLPLTAMKLPEHMFLRWKEGASFFDWEVNSPYPREALLKPEMLEEDLSKHHPEYKRARALDQNGMVSNHLYAIGRYFHAQGDLRKAQEIYEESLKLDQKNFSSLSNLATVFDLTGKPLKAIDLYTQAITVEPQYFYAYYDRGVTYSGIYQATKNLESLNKALQDFQKTVELNPSYVEGIFNLAATHHMRFAIKKNKADFAAAKANYEKTLNINPQHLGARRQLASLLEG